MRTHVQVVGGLYVAIGVLLVLGALLSFGLFGGLAAFVGNSGEEGAELGAWILGVAGSALGALFVLLAAPVLASGLGLFWFKPWARILAIVVAIVALFSFPWGTLVGVYALWVCFTPASRVLFGEAVASDTSDHLHPSR